MADELRAAARTLALLARLVERAAGDLSLAQYRILALVASGDERASLIAGRLALGKPTITAVVDGLVERGLLERHAVDGDRRAIRLALTDAGCAALDTAEGEMARKLAPVVDGVSDRPALLAAIADLEVSWEAVVRARIDAEARR